MTTTTNQTEYKVWPFCFMGRRIGCQQQQQKGKKKVECCTEVDGTGWNHGTMSFPRGEKRKMAAHPFSTTTTDMMDVQRKKKKNKKEDNNNGKEK